MSRMMFRVGSVSSSSTDDDEVHNLRPPCPRSSVWQPQTPQNTRRLRQRDELAPLVLLSVSGQRVGQGQEGQPGGQRQRGSSLFSSSRIPLSKSISTDKSCKTKEDKSVKIPKLKKTSTNESGRSPRSESLTVYGNAVPPTMKNSLAMPLGYYSLGRNAPKPQPINGMDASLDSSASGRTSDFLVGGYQRPSKAPSVHSSREHQGQTRPVPVIRLPQHRISSSEEEKTETEQKKSASDFDLHHMARKTFDRGIVTSSSLKADQRSRVRTLSNIPSSSSQSGNPTDSSSKQRYRNPAKLFSKKSKINGSCKNDDIKKSLDTKEMRGKPESDSGKDWRQARDWYSFDDDDDSRSGSFSSKSVNCGVFAGSSRGGMDGWRYRSEGGSGPVKSFSGRQTSKSSSFWESLSGYADCEDSTDDESSLNAPQKNKIRKLKRELNSAQEKIHTLTTQLTTNAHVVAAFEQSLSSMTQRLQKLTASSQQKDQELNELRRTVAAMSHPGRSGESSINKSSQRNSSSSGSSVSKSSAGNSCTAANGGSSTAAVPLDRHMSADSVSSLNSFSSALSQLSSAAGRQQQQMTHPVTAVVSSADSTSSSGDKKKVKKSWLRTSFSKAFSRKKSSRQCSLSDVEGDTVSLRSVPNSPMLHLSHTVSMPTTPIKGLNAHLSAVCVGGLDDSAVLQLRQELHEKDLKLTDIQLDALTSAHQLEQMCDMMNRLKSEMSSLKADNDRLQRIIAQKDLTHQLNSNSSHISSAAGPLDQTDSTEGSAADGRNDPEAIEEVDVEDGSNDGLEKRKLYVKVKLNPQSISSSSSSASSSPSSSAAVREKKISDIVIGVISITSTTKWETLDSQVRRKFKEYISWIDSGSGLTGSSSSNCSGGTGMGLTTDGIARYEIASVSRSKGVKAPDALSWLLTDTEDQREISLTLKGSKEGCIDSLSFESLIPRSIVQRYVSLLQEHHRIILSGPSGTGKTFLAFKLAEHVVCLSGREGEVGAVATFNVDHKSGKELRQYLSNIAEQCEHSATAVTGEGGVAGGVAGSGDLPTVIILDNLHNVGSLAEVFNGFFTNKHQLCPYIIGTMNHSPSNSSSTTTNLQLHHNFRWVLCANHTEPVRNFLSRYLRRRVLQAEMIRDQPHQGPCSDGIGLNLGHRNLGLMGQGQKQSPLLEGHELEDIKRIINWLPQVWLHVNRFLETHCSSDVTIGPRLFLSCPMRYNETLVWFTDLWNYSVVPYLLEAIREGLQIYGQRAVWEDPVDWVIDTYPWPQPDSSSLLHLRHEDVGYDSQGAGTATATTASLTAGGGVNKLSINSGVSYNHNDSSDSKDPLMSMIMRLQEAASYSSPQSNESDSASSVIEQSVR